MGKSREGDCVQNLLVNYDSMMLILQGKKLMAEIGDIINIHVIIEGSMNSSNPYYSSSWRRDFLVSLTS